MPWRRTRGKWRGRLRSGNSRWCSTASAVFAWGRIAHELETLTAALRTISNGERRRSRSKPSAPGCGEVGGTGARHRPEVRKRFGHLLQPNSPRRPVGVAPPTPPSVSKVALGRISDGARPPAPLIDGPDAGSACPSRRSARGGSRIQARASLRLCPHLRSGSQMRNASPCGPDRADPSARFFVFLSLSLIVLVRLFQLSVGRARAPDRKAADASRRRRHRRGRRHWTCARRSIRCRADVRLLCATPSS